MDNQRPAGWKALRKSSTFDLKLEYQSEAAEAFRATFRNTGPSVKVLETLVERYWHRDVIDFESAHPEVTMSYREGQRSVIQYILEALD